MSALLSGWVKRWRPVFGPFLLYLAASQLAHTLLYTIVTYFVSLADKSGSEFGNTVNEVAGQYLVLSLALAGTLLTFTMWQADKALYRYQVFWNDPYRALWQLDRPRKEELLRGLSSGAIGALTYLLFFTISGQVNYLGVYITSTLGTPIFPLFFVDLAALVVLVVCEEYLFRHKILRAVLGLVSPTAAVLLTTALHITVRNLQFQLEWIDYLTLACVNLTVGFFYLKSGKCHRGLAFLVALFCLLHNLGGLPLWGNESPSFFLFKASSRSLPLLTGGPNGPLAGLGLALVLVIFLAGSYLTWRRELEARRHAERMALAVKRT